MRKLGLTCALVAGCVSFDTGGPVNDQDGALDSALSSPGVFGYPTGDRTTYPAGGGGWFVSQPLGHWSNIYPFIGNHQAEDIRNSTSDATTFQPVYSIGDGTVLYAGPNGSTYVNVVLIKHDLPGATPVCSFYGHIDALQVSKGQTVARGQQIARIMDWAAQIDGTKNSHLHYVILPWDLCQASASTSGALVCGYDNGVDDAYHENMTIDDEPDTYQSISNACLDQNYAPFIAPSKFIRAHAASASRLVGARTGLNSNGSLELFVRGASGGIDHVWEQGGTPTGWSGWSALGGPAGSNPAVGQNADGRLEVFVVGTDGNLWHRWQTAPHGAWIASWSNLGGANLTGEPAVAMNTNGSMEVFARRADGSVAHIWEQPGTPTGWSAWGSLGGNIASNPAVGRNADGRLEVFAVGATGPLVHVWQTAPHSGWSGWGSFGGTFTSDPVVAPNADGRLQVFVRDGAAHLASTFELTGGGWSQFVTLGSFAFPSNPRAGWTADARIEIMVRGYDGALWHVWQTTPNGGWSSGATFGGNITNDPDLAQNADGHLEVFVRGANGHVLHQWISPSGWTQLSDLGGAPASL